MYLSLDAAPDLSFSNLIHFITYNQEKKPKKQCIVFYKLRDIPFHKRKCTHAHLQTASKSKMIQFFLKQK